MSIQHKSSSNMKKMKRKKEKKKKKTKKEKEMKKEEEKKVRRRQRTLLKHHPAAHLIRYTYTNIVVQRIFYAIQVYSWATRKSAPCRSKTIVSPLCGEEEMQAMAFNTRVY